MITASNAFKCVALTGFLLRASVNLAHGRLTVSPDPLGQQSACGNCDLPAWVGGRENGSE
jgi:hypothetical protein